MRIVFAMPVFYPAHSFGGPVVQAWGLSRALAERGHQVEVVTSDIEAPPETPRDQWVEVSGLRVWYSTADRLSRVPPYALPRAKRPIRDALQRADIVYSRMGLTLLNEYVSRAARRQGVPYVYAADGCLCPVRLRTKALEKWFFLRLVERPVLRRATRLHALTEKERHDYVLQGADPQRVRVVPNGVDLPELGDQGFSAARFRKTFGIPEGPILLYLGRLNADKAPDLLLEAFGRSRVGGASQLVFAGADYGMRPQLERLAKASPVGDRIHFLGPISGADIADAFHAASAFALVSHTEGLPIAALEALSFGKPCLISPACGIPEVARDNAGIVVAPDLDLLPGAIDSILSESESHPRSQMGANARRAAEQHYSMRVVVERIEELFREAIAGSA